MIAGIIAAIAVCVLCSSFFSASEMSYSSCNKVRLENAKEAKIYIFIECF